MNRAIITYGSGKLHSKMLEIALPTFRAFAKLHDWDLCVVENIGKARPAPWYKIQALLEGLKIYDEVLFLGSDTLIVDGRDDFVAPPEAWQAMVEHHTGDGYVPNTDVWLCRAQMIPYLEQVWGMTQWLTHGWWEQAALLELMGYKVHQPTRYLGRPTELYDNTYFMDHSWNVHKWDQPQPEHPRIQHSTMWPDRIAIMKQWASEAV